MLLAAQPHALAKLKRAAAVLAGAGRKALNALLLQHMTQHCILRLLCEARHLS